MLTVQDDWIQYEETPVRRAAVRGGAACRQRTPVVHDRPAPVLRLVPPPAPRPRPGRLRLTRRGRVVVAALPVMAAASIALLAAGTVSAHAAAPEAPAAARHAAIRQVVVRPGDSLWSIAERTEPGTDPRAVVATIERTNGLRSADLPVGRRLVLPALPAR